MQLKHQKLPVALRVRNHEIYTSSRTLDNIEDSDIITMSAHGAIRIWIPARVADAQPVGGIPDTVAGDGDAEKKCQPA